MSIILLLILKLNFINEINRSDIFFCKTEKSIIYFSDMVCSRTKEILKGVIFMNQATKQHIHDWFQLFHTDLEISWKETETTNQLAAILDNIGVSY